jgi:hypothetical protein
VLKAAGENRMAACHLNDNMPASPPLKVNP